MVAAVGVTDNDGNAALALPLPGLPSLVGVSFYGQWLTTGGSACAGALELSNALSVQIQ